MNQWQEIQLRVKRLSKHLKHSLGVVTDSPGRMWKHRHWHVKAMRLSENYVRKMAQKIWPQMYLS